MDLLGVHAVALRASHNADERSAIVADFNDSSSHVQVLVTCVRLGGTGYDLHLCCCKGIVISWPWSMNTLLQILGRLIRLAQPRFVEWQLWTVEGTIYDKQMLMMLRKYVLQLSAESRIPGQLRGWIATVVAWELIHVYIHTPHNMFGWTVLRIDIGTFHHELMIELSGLFSQLARAALAEPGRHTKLNKASQLELYVAAVRINELLHKGELARDDIDVNVWVEHASLAGFVASEENMPAEAVDRMEKAIQRATTSKTPKKVKAGSKAKSSPVKKRKSIKSTYWDLEDKGGDEDEEMVDAEDSLFGA